MTVDEWIGVAQRAAAKFVSEIEQNLHFCVSRLPSGLRECVEAIVYKDPPLYRWAPTHVHRKGGHYRVIARGKIEATLEPCVIYDNAGGEVWVRPAAEFDDGRFTPIGGAA